jgi:dsRNA-specific ribonuclease
LPLARYRVIKEKGPEHQKVFTVEIIAGSDWVAQGSGGSKKTAEQQAAWKLLELLARDTEVNG